jgi:hypothetical protein
MEHDAIIKFAKEAAAAAFDVADEEWMPSADDSYCFMRDQIWNRTSTRTEAELQTEYDALELTEHDMHAFRSAFAAEVERLRAEAPRG